MSEAAKSRLDRLTAPGGLLAIGGAILLGIGFSQGREAFFQAYLFGWWLVASLVFGCFGLTLLHHAVRNRWSLPILRIWEAGGGWRTLALLLVLMIPIWIGAPSLFAWGDPANFQVDEVLAHRGWWMYPAAVYIRTVLIFGVFIAIGFLNQKWTRLQEESGRKVWLDRRASLSAVSILLFFVLMTIFTTDWAMALDNHWFSTVYGPLFIVGQGLTALALAAIVIGTQHRKEPYVKVVNPQLTKDIGNLTLAFTMLWAYLNLSQYLIIWSGNLPEFITYYVARTNNLWQFIGAVLLLGQFFIPFLLLLSPRAKRDVAVFTTIGVWIFAMRPLDFYYILVPSLQGGTPNVAFLLPLAGAAMLMIGIWLAMFSFNIKGAPLLPHVKDDPDDNMELKEAAGSV